MGLWLIDDTPKAENLTFFSIVCFISALRYSNQLRRHGRLLWEDYIHMFAVVQCYALLMISFVPYIGYTASHFGKNAEQKTSIILDLWKVASLLFISTLYTSKAVFLALYLRLFGVSRRFRLAWYAMVALTAVAFMFSFALQFWQCAGVAKPFRWHDDSCQVLSGPGWVHWETIAALVLDSITDMLSKYDQSASEMCLRGYAECVWSKPTDTEQGKIEFSDVLADRIPVVTLPLVMIVRLQMKRSRKGGFAAIFMLGLIVTVFNIVTYGLELNQTYAGSESGNTAITVLLNTTPPLAVTIAALPPVVFSRSHTRVRRSGYYSGYSGSRGRGGGQEGNAELGEDVAGAGYDGRDNGNDNDRRRRSRSQTLSGRMRSRNQWLSSAWLGRPQRRQTDIDLEVTQPPMSPAIVISSESGGQTSVQSPNSRHNFDHVGETVGPQ